MPRQEKCKCRAAGYAHGTWLRSMYLPVSGSLNDVRKERSVRGASPHTASSSAMRKQEWIRVGRIRMLSDPTLLFGPGLARSLSTLPDWSYSPAEHHHARHEAQLCCPCNSAGVLFPVTPDAKARFIAFWQFYPLGHLDIETGSCTNRAKL